MHELSITENILEISSHHARLQNAAKVTSINLVIGQLSSIIDDSIQFYWDFVTEDSICSGAKLVFKRIPAVFRCTTCNTEFSLEDKLSPCPTCNSYNLNIISGEEFYVDSIEIEKSVDNN